MATSHKEDLIMGALDCMSDVLSTTLPCPTSVLSMTLPRSTSVEVDNKNNCIYANL